MTTLQDIMGLITKRKIKVPTDKDYIVSAAYTDTQEVLKPQPKMEASLLSLAGIKSYVLASVVPPTPQAYKLYTAYFNKGVAGSLTVTEISNDTGYTFSWEVSGSGLNIASSGVIENSAAGIYSTYSLPTDGTINALQTTSIKQALIQSSSVSISAVTLNMSTGVYNQSSTYSGIFELRVYGI